MPKKKWILTVDDDPAILNILEGALAHPELTITTASDAQQAFIQARDIAPLLIICDIMMPGSGDGTTMLKLLRADPRIPRVPIIFMTSMDLKKARALLPFNDPTIGLIPKPLDLDKLRKYVWDLAGVAAPPDLTSELRKVVIIGSGAAAYTAAIYAARANMAPLVFGGVSMGGQLMITSEVENFPGFPEPISGPELMERMQKQVERLGVAIINEYVVKVDLSRRPFYVETSEGTAASANTLIIATGANAKWLGIESEKRLMGHGVSACATCDGFFFKDKEVVVVGGGDTAMEEATFLTKFASKVIVVHRRSVLRASKIMQNRARKNPKISFIWDTAIDDITGNGQVDGVKLKNLKTNAVTALKCGGVFMAIGHTPTTSFLGGQLKMDENGYVIADDRTHTSVPGVFAAGDVMDHRYRQAITAAGMGCKAALEAERWLEDQATH